jgi:hypothetical protein
MEKTHMRRTVAQLFLTLLTILGVTLVTPLVTLAQEDFICSADQIESALDDLECIADGAFISTESAVTAIVERCSDLPTERACRRCFKRAQSKLVPALKTLSKLSLVERGIVGAIKASLGDEVEAACSETEDELPPDGDQNNDEPIGMPTGNREDLGFPLPFPGGPQFNKR